MEMRHLVYPKCAVKVVKTQGSVLNHKIIPRMDRYHGNGNGTSDLPHQPLVENQHPLHEPSTVGDKHIQWNRIQPSKQMKSALWANMLEPGGHCT